MVMRTYEDYERQGNATHRFGLVFQTVTQNLFLQAHRKVSKVRFNRDKNRIIQQRSDGSACCSKAHGMVTRNKGMKDFISLRKLKAVSD